MNWKNDSQCRWADHLSDYLDGTADDRVRADVEEHLAECGSCRGLLEELRAIVLQAGELPELQPDRDLWGGIEATIQGAESDAKVIALPVGPTRVERDTVDLGEIAIVPGVLFRGRVVDAEGQARALAAERYLTNPVLASLGLGALAAAVMSSVDSSILSASSMGASPRPAAASRGSSERPSSSPSAGAWPRAASTVGVTFMTKLRSKRLPAW